jgi:MSHA biogenesis protein MshL
VRELLFALARDAKVNVDIHPGISGVVTLNALNQTLPQLLARIAGQVDIRYELKGNHLAVLPDSAFLRSYRVDYVNMARETTGAVSVSTEIGSTGRGALSQGTGEGSASSTRLTSSASNRFWDTLTYNLCSIVAATRVFTAEEREALRSAQQREREERLTLARSVASAGQGAPQLLQQVATTTVSAGPNISCAIAPGTATGGGAAPAAAASAASSNVPIIANRETGVVSIFASSRQHERVQEFLDLVMASARRQVLIEATIVEVELSSNYQQGINWQRLRDTVARDGVSITQQPSGVSPLGSGARPGDAAGVAVNPVTTALQGATGLASGLFSVSLFNANSRIFGSIAAAVSLLESYGKVRVLSSPKLSVLNNQTSVLKVVDNVVYFTLQAQIQPATVDPATGLQTAPRTVTYTSTPNSVPVGFVMSVTPFIDEAGGVTMNVRPTISRVLRYRNDPSPVLSQASVTSPVPEIQTREMESVLKVQDGQIAVLGGLMQDSINDATDSVPGLSRLPFAGELFKYRNDTSKKTELVIFMRPVVLKEASIDGDQRPLRDLLPDRDFFKQPNALQPAPFSLNVPAAN